MPSSRKAQPQALWALIPPRARAARAAGEFGGIQGVARKAAAGAVLACPAPAQPRLQAPGPHQREHRRARGMAGRAATERAHENGRQPGVAGVPAMAAVRVVAR